MEAEKLRAKNSELDKNNVFQVSERYKLLKSAAIYGANASGKSNLLKAFGVMRFFVTDSAINLKKGDLLPADTFRLHEENDNKPLFFEIIFLINGVRYRYGFEFTKKRVVSEWLYYVDKRESLLFERINDNIKIMPAFKEGKKLDDATRENALFLSVVSHFNGPIANKIVEWFQNIGFISGLDDYAYKFFTISNFNNDKFNKGIKDFLREMDVNIDDILVNKKEISKIDEKVINDLASDYDEEIQDEVIEELRERKSFTVEAIHKKYGQNQEFIGIERFNIEKNESEGTKKLFYLMGPILDTLKSGTIMIADEFDARLHPLITCALINLFNSNRTNPKNAQLIFATHDTNLLNKELFRRDQIWFTEKDKYGSTDLYSLAEMKIRNDASYEKDYISGKYGSIPFIGEVDYILGGWDEQE